MWQLLTNGIDFVHENKTWLMIFGIGKHLANHSGTFTDVFVDDGTGDNFEKVAIELAGHCSRQERLARA